MTTDSFPAVSLEAYERALNRQVQLTKPRGSLGRLEEIAIHLASWFDDPLPTPRPAHALLFAADHEVSRLVVSAYPREVTRAMVHNFLSGGAAACVLSRHQRVALTIVDVGVEGEPFDGFDSEYVRSEVANAVTGDIVTADAMDELTLDAALLAGRNAIKMLPNDVRVVILGEMGIGNTTVAAALAGGLLGGDACDWVGRGTGVDDHRLAAKRQIVDRALKRVRPVSSALECLRKLGGREIAAMVGAILEATRHRRVVLVDGFIVTAAALVAARIEPRVLPGLLFAHRSAESSHGRMLDALSARPLLDLNLRLGEGSGALVALSLLDMACALHKEMATFTSAGVPEQQP